MLIGWHPSRAKARGIRQGRKPKLALHQQREALERRERGEETHAEIGRSYNVSGWTISRFAEMRALWTKWERYRERRKVRAAFTQYLDPEKVAELAKNPDPLRLECNTAWLSCLFIQVHDDTPEEIQQHCEKVIPICIEHHGVVFSGLASLWLIAFGPMFDLAYSPGEAHRDSRTAAARILEALGQNVKIIAFEGDMAYGNVGSQQRFNFTVVTTRLERYLLALSKADFGSLTELRFDDNI